ncbi:YcxB family protein [Streptomyces sp. NPDC050528]|uniref:YcxB family protein n=1 Tax=unclassified Streptomyces TaxID=2593676 RepID=UPI0037A8C6AE
MDMGRDPRDLTGESVELVYQLTVEDFTAALKARRRVSRSGRRQLWMFGGAVFFALVAVAVSLAGGESVPLPLIAGLIMAVLLLMFQPWLMARQFHRHTERRGVFRATVTDVGVSVVTDDSSTSINWTVQPRYRETPDAFFLFSSDKNAVGVTLLPKRGLADPTDADRLRAILDAHALRV